MFIFRLFLSWVWRRRGQKKEKGALYRQFSVQIKIAVQDPVGAVTSPRVFSGHWSHPGSSCRRKAGPAAFLHPVCAHIYALGVSAASRWILMCFKEVSPVLSSSLHPSLPLTFSSLPPPCCWSAGSRCAQTSSAFRLVGTPMAPHHHRDCVNQTTSPGSKLS